MRTRYVRSFVALLAAVLLLGVATPAVAGNVDKPRPIHGIYIDPGDFVEPTIECDEGFPTAGQGTGRLSHLGSLTWHAEFCMEFLDATHVKVDVAEVTIVAANGDLLYGSMTATGELLPDGSLVNTQYVMYEGGTGRFEHAVGSGVAHGVIAPDGYSYNTIEGVLAYDASDRGSN